MVAIAVRVALIVQNPAFHSAPWSEEGGHRANSLLIKGGFVFFLNNGHSDCVSLRAEKD